MPLAWQSYAATLLAVAGIAALTQASGFTAPRSGDLLILAAAVVRAVHVVVVARMCRGNDVDSMRLTFVQLTTAWVVFGLIVAMTDGLDTVGDTLGSYDVRRLSLLLYLAAFCTLVAFLVQLWAVRRTSPSRVSLLLGTEPLWAAVVGIGVAGDPFTVFSVVGASLVLIGTSWGRRVDSRRVRPGEVPAAASRR